MKAIALKILIALASVFAPIQSVMMAALVLIACDLVSGVLAAKRRGKKIASSGFQRTIVKLLVYEVAIALGFIAQHYLMLDAMPVANIVGSYVGLTELTSIYENINDMSGGQLLKVILERLNSKNNPPNL